MNSSEARNSPDSVIGEMLKSRDSAVQSSGSSSSCECEWLPSSSRERLRVRRECEREVCSGGTSGGTSGRGDATSRVDAVCRGVGALATPAAAACPPKATVGTLATLRATPVLSGGLGEVAISGEVALAADVLGTGLVATADGTADRGDAVPAEEVGAALEIAGAALEIGGAWP